MGLFVWLTLWWGLAKKPNQEAECSQMPTTREMSKKQELQVTSLVGAVLEWHSLARDQELSPYPPLFN